MPKAKAKPAEIVATMTPYVDQQQRLLVVLAVARGVPRCFAVAPPNRGPVTLERTQREVTAAATIWARERGAASLEWQAAKVLPLPDCRDLAAAMAMVRSDLA
ncbi:MAG: hypothetical protein ABUL60_11945 [Myxococcales bacterium]